MPFSSASTARRSRIHLFMQLIGKSTATKPDFEGMGAGADTKKRAPRRCMLLVVEIAAVDSDRGDGSGSECSDESDDAAA